MATTTDKAPTTTEPQAEVTSTGSGSGSGSTDKKLDGAELLAALRNQIEFYFSKQNLNNDTYLVQQMNAHKDVAIKVIAAFPKVRALTTDYDLLVKVMRECSNCRVNDAGTMVRPTVKKERDTLILRDIPTSTPVEEVKTIFSFSGCPEVVDIHADVGNTFFVKFKSESDCTKTAMALIGKTFKGKPIRARVKAAHLVRGFYTQKTAKSGSTGGAFTPNADAAPWTGGTAGPNGNYYYGGGQMGYNPANGAYWAQQQAYAGQYGGWNPSMGDPYGASNGVGPHDMGRKGARGGRFGGSRGGMRGMNGAPHTGPQAENARKKKTKGQKRRQAARKAQSSQAGTAQPNGVRPAATTNGSGAAAGGKGRGRGGRRQPQLGPEHFPALPTSKKGGGAQGSGYTRPFLKYTRETMADVIKRMSQQGVERPAALPDCVAVQKAAMKESQLLKPFPVMYPASPSPMLMASAAKGAEGPVPALDLGSKVLDVGKGRGKSSPQPWRAVSDKGVTIAAIDLSTANPRSVGRSSFAQMQAQNSGAAAAAPGANVLSALTALSGNTPATQGKANNTKAKPNGSQRQSADDAPKTQSGKGKDKKSPNDPAPAAQAPAKSTGTADKSEQPAAATTSKPKAGGSMPAARRSYADLLKK